MRWILALVAALALSSPAAAKWREASTAHFVIYSEQSEDKLRDFATRLERYDAAMRNLRAIPDRPIGDATRLTVYAVRDLGTLHKLYGKGASRGGHYIAGFYLPRAEGSIAFTPRSAGAATDLNAETVLLHEYAHHFMLNTYTAAFPAWLIEGFAEFHSTARFEKDGSVGLGLPAMHRARSLMVGVKIPIEKLLASGIEELSPEHRGSLYARGWLLTHYLTFERSREGQFAKYIRLVNQGTTSLDAARQAFGDLKQLDRELDKYMMRPMSYVKLPPERIKIGPIRIRELSLAEQAVMEVRMRSDRGVNLAQAQALVPLARRAAAPFPDAPAAQIVLAEAEFDARNYAEAVAAADRALAVDPKSIDALLYKARAQMALARKDGKFDKATWAGIRKLVATANRADPDDPEPLIVFYQSFLEQGIEPTANAAMGLITAQEDAPQDRDLRMRAAFQLLKDGKGERARQMLVPIAFDPHGGKIAAAAAQLIKMLDKSDVKAALALSASLKPNEDEEEGGEGPADKPTGK